MQEQEESEAVQAEEFEKVVNERDELYDKNAKLAENLNHSVHLCYNIVKGFYPILGLRTRSVVDLCKLTEESGFFTPKEFLCLKVSAYLHNIGLTRISRELLTKLIKHPEKMTADDLELIHKHPEYAEELVKDFIGDLQDLGQTVRAAHERWDGSGYPDKLPMERIPKMARYLAIAVYYVESPTSVEETVEEMIKLSGEAFHPETLRLFLKVTETNKLPDKVEELLFAELKEGMILAHPVHTPNGLLLFPEDHSIDKNTLTKLTRFNSVEPIHDRILVYKNSAEDKATDT